MSFTREFELHTQPLLSRQGIRRAPELRTDPDALHRGWRSAMIMRVDRDGRFPTDMTPHGLRVALEPGFDLSDQPPRKGIFLGLDDLDRHVWVLPVDSISEAVRTSDLRAVGPKLADQDAALVAEALSLVNWHRDLVRDSDPLRHPRSSEAGWSARSAVHGGIEFPRTDPAVICLVHDGGRRMVLGRGPRWPETFYSVQAGFVEAGESLERCVYREILEETGLEVGRIRYLGSQPWPFPRSLMVGFHAVADPNQPLRPDGEELVDARWYDVDEVRAFLRGDGPIMLPSSVSIARVMIESWVRSVDED